MEGNKKLQDDFFKILVSMLHRLVPTPSHTTAGLWSDGDVHLQEGDIVLMKKQETDFNQAWHVGRVSNIVEGRYRKVTVEYVNASEKTKRTTERRERDLVLLQGIDDLDLGTEAHRAAVATDVSWKRGCSEKL